MTIIQHDHKHGTILIPLDTYQWIKENKMYITVNTKPTTRGIYKAVIVCKKEKGKLIFRKPLARIVLDAPPQKHVDHISGDTLDNRRENLRLVTNKENVRNSAKAANKLSRFKGVYKMKNKFHALVICDAKRYRISPFNTEEEAALAYNKLAKLLFGEFARLNEL